MRLLNLNIANRLRLGFGLLLVFIAVLAFVGYKSLDKLHQGTTDLARLAWPRARYTNIALDNVRGSMGRVGQLVAVDDPSIRAAAAQRLAANLDAADKAMQDLEPLLVSPTGKTLLAEARTHRDAYVALVGKVRALLAEGKKDEARDLAYGKRMTRCTPTPRACAISSLSRKGVSTSWRRMRTTPMRPRCASSPARRRRPCCCRWARRW